jgi:hypothetical protein
MQKQEPTALHGAVQSRYIIGVGAGLDGKWASFGSPRELSLTQDEVDGLIMDDRTDEQVKADLGLVRRCLHLKWLKSEANRRLFVRTVLQAELRGFLTPTVEDGAIVVTAKDGAIVARMGNAMTWDEMVGFADDFFGAV